MRNMVDSWVAYFLIKKSFSTTIFLLVLKIDHYQTFQMQHVIEVINTTFSDEKPSYAMLGKLVKSLDVDKIDFTEALPDITETSQYARNILQTQPLECILLHWPAGVESAIHYHGGFWGYVMVLQGTCDNITYKLGKGRLTEDKSLRAIKGGVINEPDGTIHKIVNPSKNQALVTLHFYYPALENLNNLVLYSEDGTKGILNEKAACASFDEAKAHFKLLEENAFTFHSYLQSPNAKSHRLYPIIPKPSSSQINEMIGTYYCEQAEQYDLFDFNHSSRKKYTEKINSMIANELNQSAKVKKYLALACGTGRRAIDIQSQSEHDYQITGVDLSLGMCEIATSRGLKMHEGDWLSVDVTESEFDVCTFLYAFGHLTTHDERKQALLKIYSKLKKGGILFFDVFNVNDKYEWGANAVDRYHDYGLDQWGYECGDVFYKKTEGEEIAFLHYFDQQSLANLLVECGFKVACIHHIGYVHKSGEILDKEDEGSLFIKAVKG